ncbi:uncharacterized protein LOC131646513 [Vicia villosa]|uniref:uncharacterized protein LOC131646513 n=1 Tax=Vicia villosa TaxID=3911 RepID=UPI00273AE944|nr:uncharacterized protein LOC131646513 [Vicia villosa]
MNFLLKSVRTRKLNVIIVNNVEIGANTCIDRGRKKKLTVLLSILFCPVMGYGTSSQTRFVTIIISFLFTSLLTFVNSDEEVVAMIKPLEGVEEASKRLMQEAYQGGNADNITCVVVCFLMNQVCCSILAPCKYPCLDRGFVHWSSGGYPNM